MKTRAELIEVMEDAARKSGLLVRRDDIEYILTAIEANGAQVVPVEATDEMCARAWEAPCARQDADNAKERNRYRCEPIYTAMLSANPFKPE